MGTASTYRSGSTGGNESDLDPTKKKPPGAGTGNADFDAVNKPDPATFGANNLANRPVTPVGGSVAGGVAQTGNGSRIPQSPMNPNPGYATRPGIGKTDFDAVNKPTPETFGQNNLANRPVRQVGRSMMDPQRQAEMARRRAVANGDLDGAAKIVMDHSQQNPGAAAPQVAGGVPAGNGSRIPQSPMNPNPGYATRPGIGKTDFDAINNPKPETFGANSLANRPVRQVGRSMMDPQRQAEMARRRAVANAGMSDAGEDEETPPGRAKGGPVKAGKPYLVGEEGPEIIVPKESGTVVPNHAIQFLPMDERAGNAFSPAMRSDDESVRDDAAAPGLRRQISGLFMRPRAMPPEFARQQLSGGYDSSNIAGSTSAGSAPETSAGDEADDQRGAPWGSRRPQIQPAPPTADAAASRLFQKRDAPKAFFMQQRGMGAGGSSSRPSFEGDRGATAVAQLAGLAQSPRGGSSQGGSLSERLQQVAARMRAKEQRHDAPTPPAKKGAWGQAPVQTANKAPQPLASDRAGAVPDQFKIHEADESAEFVLTDKKTDQPIQKDRKFGEHARSILNEELNNSPTARALLQKAYDLSGKHVVIKMKNAPGEAQPHIGLDGTITIFINPNTLRTGTLSHEIAHVIEGWKLAQGQRNRTITSGEAIDAARMDGRRELDGIAPVMHDVLLDETTGALKMAGQGPRDWKENEAMRAGNIVNAEISAAKVKAQLEVIKKTDEALYNHLMNNPEEIAHMFWEEQKEKEAGIHQDNEGRPIPQGTRYGRYNYESVLKLLGNGVTREHLKKMKPNNW